MVAGRTPMLDVHEAEPCNVAAEILRSGDDAAVALRFRSQDERYDVSRGELRARVRQVAAALRRLGLQEEQRVLVILPDCPESIYAFLGAIWAGAVPVLVSSFLRPTDYALFVRETRARAVVASEVVIEALHGALGEGRGVPALLSVGNARSGELWQAIEGVSASEAALLEPFPSHRDDAAFWLYSSGTSGRPKGVIHLHGNIPHAVQSYGRHVLDVGAKDVAYSTSKLFFAYGLGASLYFPLSAGASVVLSPEPFTPLRAWKILEEERPSLFFAVPSVYRALLGEAPANAREALANVRRSASAGEALPEAIFDEWKRRFGVEILDGLGSTEALHIFLSNRPGDIARGSLGRPVPGYDVEVADENGAPAPSGAAGELRVRGGSIAAGYWQRSEATRHAFRGQWLMTGDHAIHDEDGTFRVLGRVDDMLKVSGQWVAPVQVERVIAALDSVRECAVVGIGGQSGLTELIACVVIGAADPADTRARVEAACAESLPRFKRPRRVVFFDALPRTATGKVQRFVLRQAVAEQSAGEKP